MENNVVLTEEQSRALNYVLKLVTDKQFHAENKTAVILTGPASSGKTMLLNMMSERVRAINRVVKCVASTGVAALSFEGGKTSHSAFGFSRAPNRNNSKMTTHELQQLALIVFDNVNFEAVRHIKRMDTQLQNNLQSEKPFGGIVTVFAADFGQVPPVSGDSESLRLSRIYDELCVFNLEQVFNVTADYSRFLHTVNDSNMVLLDGIPCTEEIQDVIDFVYPEEILQNPDNCSKRCILTTTNTGARNITEEFIRSKIAPARILEIAPVEDDEYFDENDEEDEEEILPNEPLKIWVGSVCSFVRTSIAKDDKRYIVGTKAIIESYSEDYIAIRLPFSTEVSFIGRKLFTCRGVMFRQFPLRLCYATTIHKSQSLRFDKVGVELSSGVFRHGQLYLAMSRVLSRDDVIVCLSPYQNKQSKKYTENNINPRLVN